jgi:L-ascorbate metabolism protein UlaG (beta-lactamase superfamily)
VSGGRITFVGHATVLIEQAGVRMLTDPLLRGGVAYVRRRVAVPDVETFRDLDAVLISHAHHDHLDVASLRKLAHRGPVVAPRGCAQILRRAGFADVTELDDGGRCSVGPIELEAIAARHDGRRLPFTQDIPALGFLLEGPTRVYFAGDTDLFDGMEALAGRVDVALLPIWGWGPRLPEGHLNPDTAARAVQLIRPAVVIPVHWGTLGALWMRPDRDPQAPARAFAEAVAAVEPDVEVRVLAPGASMDLSPDSGDARRSART